MSKALKPLIVIKGPTASGKSELANTLAAQLSGVVFSIDAFQIYRGMDIGTAKISTKQQSAPHALLDIAQVDEVFSAAKFQEVARAHIDTERVKGMWCVLCGGSGLYLDAVVDEMDFAEGQANTPLRKALEEMPTPELYATLVAKDPKSAQVIDPHNKRRLIRALEMLQNNTSYAEENKKLHQRNAHYPTLSFVLSWPRHVLYERINTRAKQMFQAGLIEETQALLASGLDISQTASKAIGYQEAIACIEGRLSEEEAVYQCALRTRHYAKRQIAWLKRDGRGELLDMQELGQTGALNAIVKRISEWSE